MPPVLRDRLRLPVIGAPMFIVGGPELVLAQSNAGIVGSFPALNARPQQRLDGWLERISKELQVIKERRPDARVAPLCRQCNVRLQHDLDLCVKPTISQARRAIS